MVKPPSGIAATDGERWLEAVVELTWNLPLIFTPVAERRWAKTPKPLPSSP